MMDTLINAMAFLALGFPAVPWLLRARSGKGGIWIGTGLAIVTLIAFPFIFFAACVAVNCGQGAIAIFMLGPVWIGSAVITVLSAVLAAYSLRRRERRE